MAERTLFLHLGHHRTGTSYLQTHVFPKLSGLTYFYKKEAAAAAGIVNAFRGSPAIWRRSGNEIFHALVDELDHRQASSRSVLISAEEMSAHRLFAVRAKPDVNVRRDPFLLAAHLRESRTVAARWGFGLKAILGIRRQDQYLASRYAKHGILSDETSQANFEQQVHEIIDPAKRYFFEGVWLDFKSTGDLLIEALGHDGLLTLPLEQLSLGSDRARYFSALSNFLGMPISFDAFSGSRVEARSAGCDRWRIKEAKVERHHPWWANLIAQPTARVFRNIEISLTKELKDQILNTYSESNRLLAADIDTDLGRYGYYGGISGIEAIE